MKDSTDYIEGDIPPFKYVREYWRYYLSGQFIHYFGLVEDWSGEHERRNIQAIHNIIGRVTEVYLFARNLAFRSLLGEAATIEIDIRNTADRELVHGDLMEGLQHLYARTHNYKCSVSSIETRRLSASGKLLADPWLEARTHCKDVLAQYNWRLEGAPGDEMLATYQHQLFERLMTEGVK